MARRRQGGPGPSDDEPPMPTDPTSSPPGAPAAAPAVDFASLRAEAIARLGLLAAGRWTDFNDHDPGIMILEQLCYALTDLAYRVDYDIPDLLASSGDPARALYTPGQVLSSEPVTL